jgi:hypothetical protein
MTDRRNITQSVLVGLAYIFFNRKRSLWLCILFVLASFGIEKYLGIANFFSCSGAVVTLAGLFLNIKYSLNFHLQLPKVNLYNKLAGAGVWGTVQVTKEQERWVDEILSDEMYGVTFMIVGTLIWAYGGYLIAALP